MNYSQTLEYLFNSLPMFQRQGKAAYKANLDSTYALDKHFGYPHRQFKSIHIAGTNGKGSVSHMLASVLQEAGYKTGLYTSPHLKDFRERIKINGIEIPENYVINFVKNNRDFFEKLKPSFFEMTVAMAFKYFADENIDVAIIEVGMGGRLDSTNIITPLLSVITNISKDHTQFLGDTIEKIAAEKAGIIKKATPVVIGESQKETRQVFLNKAKEQNAPIYFADEILSIDYSLQTIDEKQSFNVYKADNIVYREVKIDLLGLYQKKNLITTLQAIELLSKNYLSISENHIFKGLANIQKNTGLKGRWQIIGHNPRIVCDTGHNEAGIQAVIKQIKNTPYRKLYMIIGVVNDKNIEAILELLPKNAEYIFTKASIPRALNEKDLALKAAKYGLKGIDVPNVPEALKLAKSKAGASDMIFVGGSTFVVADII